MTRTILGHAVQRREDPRFITGAANFLDDVAAEGALHALFVRSPVAHALVHGIDAGAARDARGVVDVVTGAELNLPPAGSMRRAPAMAHPRLAGDRVRFVGEPVAVVVADTLA